MSLCDGYSSSSFNSSHHEFRSPHPPLYPALTPTTTASRGVLTRASAAMQNSVILHSHFSNYNNNNNCSTTCSSGGVSGGTGGGGASGCCFDGASSTASSTTSTPSTPTRRQNRRTRLPPIKISPDGVEVNDILRKIQKCVFLLHLFISNSDPSDIVFTSCNHHILLPFLATHKFLLVYLLPPPPFNSFSLILSPATSFHYLNSPHVPPL